MRSPSIDVVAPLARAFRPDIIVAQLGVDAHYSDPQTELALTLPGYRALVRGIIGLADELCEGRLAALGGGGYHIVDVVPLAWTWVLAELRRRGPVRRRARMSGERRFARAWSASRRAAWESTTASTPRRSGPSGSWS